MPHLLDIVIPCYGKSEMIRECVKHVAPEHRIILVDDCGPEFPVELKNTQKVVRTPSNKGFPAAVNLGVSRGKSPLVMLLNTDVTLTDTTIPELLKEMDRPEVGIAGPMLIFPEKSKWGTPGKVQHAGMAFDITGKPLHLYLGWSPNNPRVEARKEVQAVTGACFITRRALWEKIGGLWEGYGKGTYEDVEYCVRVKELGFQVIYQPHAVAIHAVGGSEGQFPLSENYFKFRQRCKVTWSEYKLW